MAFSDYFSYDNYNSGDPSGVTGSIEDLSAQVQALLGQLSAYSQPGSSTFTSDYTGPGLSLPSSFSGFGAIDTSGYTPPPAANAPSASALSPSIPAPAPAPANNTLTSTNLLASTPPEAIRKGKPSPQTVAAAPSPANSGGTLPGQSPTWYAPTAASQAAIAPYSNDDLSQLYQLQDQLSANATAIGNATPGSPNALPGQAPAPTAQQLSDYAQIGSVNQLINKAYAQDVANTDATYAGYGVQPLGQGATENQVLQATVMQPQALTPGWTTQGSILTTPQGNTIDLSKLSANDAYHNYSGDVWAAWKQWNASQGGGGGVPNPFGS